MALTSTENLEYYVNEVLREDLKHLDKYISKYNEEITEYVQLKNTIQTMQQNLDDGFKTQMNIGGNIFMEAKVESMDKILVDVGKGCFVEFTLEEALKFAKFKIKVLTNECDVLREASVKKRGDVKLALMCMAENEKLHEQEKEKQK